MSDDEKINGKPNGIEEVEIGKNSAPERNEKGQFVNFAGPGRKKTADIELDGELFADVEKVIRKGMASKDIALRLKAAALGVRLESVRKADTTEKSVISPEMEVIVAFVVTIVERFERKDGASFPANEAMRIISQHMRDCPDSPFLVIDDPVEYVEPEDDL
jgi:hypothetical protein